MIRPVDRGEIVWINGTFGSGKTTLAALLRAHIPGSLTYDPELIGIAVQRILPRRIRPEDFRATWWWQRVTVAALGILASTGRTVIVPMCVTDECVRSLVQGRLRSPCTEFWLSVSEATLRGRVSQRSEPSRSWSLSYLEEAARFERGLPADIVCLDGENLPMDIVPEVVAGLAQPLRTDHSSR